MLDRLMELFTQATQGDGEAPGKDDLRVAAAALLVHAAYIDGTVNLVEEKRIEGLLADKFALTDDEVKTVMRAGEREESEAVDLFGFTSTLTQHLGQDGRQDIVRMLWEVVLADGNLHDYEDTLVRRVGDLLGVSTRDRITLRKEVENARSAAGATET